MKNGEKKSWPGETFDIGGRRLHAVVTGEHTGKTPVVLEAGLTAMSSCWAWVQQELGAKTRVLSYDRAGLGWSDPANKPKDAISVASDLHDLLDKASFPKPFIYVGHSMGGIFARAYQAKYPGDVAGMVLVDASHPEQIERSPNIKKALRKFFWFLKATPVMASCGIMRVCGDFGMSAQAAGLPAMHQLVAKNFYSSTQHMRTTVCEAEAWFRSAAQVRDLKLGELPLKVITAPEKCMTGWIDLQKELAQLSTRGQHIEIPGATHVTVLTQQQFATRVAAEIAELL